MRCGDRMLLRMTPDVDSRSTVPRAEGHQTYRAENNAPHTQERECRGMDWWGNLCAQIQASLLMEKLQLEAEMIKICI